MKVIQVKSSRDRIRKVKSLILSVGNKIGAVSFLKRSDGKLRKMAYRLHVKRPTYASSPNGKNFIRNRAKDSDNLQITVFDTNKVRYNSKGRMSGRGDWRTIPLETVTRIKANGEIYKIIG